MVTDLQSWKALTKHYEKVKRLHLKELFETEPDRGTKYSLQVGDLFLDYSKNRITDETLELFWRLLNEIPLRQKIDGMFAGEKINTVEYRSVLHVALRNRTNTAIMVDGKNVMDDVNETLTKMGMFSEKVRSEEWKGHTGRPIRNIINIGIGGSYLGPEMAYEALKYYADRRLTVRFISNIDPSDFFENTADLDPEETLFIVASKTFTTLETMTNAKTARGWVLERMKDESSIAKHFVALSTNTQGVSEFGIDPENMFVFWDWVGGRYSLTSAIGLPLMIAIGDGQFVELLEGFHRMDNHFKSADFKENMPVIMAILGVWYNNFFEAQTHAVFPYSQYLKRLPAYLTQAEMESNGKHMTIESEKIHYQTSPVLWGDTGTNVQHSATQLILQGTKLIPCDFIGFKEPLHNIGNHHKILMANLAAQAEAMAFGTKFKDEPYKDVPGNVPTNTLLASKLTPNVLGQIISLYEHKIFTQGVIWGINSFDQFGVELGKELAKGIITELENPTSELHHDSSTNNLLSKIRS